MSLFLMALVGSDVIIFFFSYVLVSSRRENAWKTRPVAESQKKVQLKFRPFMRTERSLSERGRSERFITHFVRSMLVSPMFVVGDRISSLLISRRSNFCLWRLFAISKCDECVFSKRVKI